jgi:hypothetical protein
VTTARVHRFVVAHFLDPLIPILSFMYAHSRNLCDTQWSIFGALSRQVAFSAAAPRLLAELFRQLQCRAEESGQPVDAVVGGETRPAVRPAELMEGIWRAAATPFPRGQVSGGYFHGSGT